MPLVRHFLSVGSATLASRVLGFVRDSLMAAVIGTGPVADAFFVAFRLPNLFRRLFAEGAFNAAFVPLYARRTLEGGDDTARRFAGEALGLVASVAALVTMLAMIGAPLLVFALAPGFRDDPQKFDSAVTMARICLPYLACLSLAGLFAGILAARRRYMAAAFAPVLLNIVTIVCLIVLLATGAEHTWEAGLAISVAVLASGFAQLGLMVRATARAGLLPAVSAPRFSPEIRRLLMLGTPGMIAGGIAQINITVGTIIASLDPGAVSVLYYADRVYQLPLGVVGIAIGMVLLPEMMHALGRDRADIALAAQNRSLEFAALLTVPAAAALVVLAEPIVEVLFERGAFGPQDTSRTANALIAFAIGLPAFVAIKVLSPAFFAREDTRTPMLASLAAVGINVALALALFRHYHEVAIALATTVAGWCNAGLLLWLLIRRGHWRPDLRLEQTLKGILGTALLMSMVLWFIRELLEPWTGAENLSVVKFSALGSLVAGGMAIYFGAGHVMGVFDLGGIRESLRWRGDDADSPPPDP